jgi:hypothetical protein
MKALFQATSHFKLFCCPFFQLDPKQANKKEILKEKLHLISRNKSSRQQKKN